ncbi:MAG TPA: gluconokinase [Terriglobales bacterium]|jgi:carbohydrate kinase (thermoresistant glucokinase family)
MVILVTGVAGSGKTTVGQLLSQQLEWPFVDADDYHPKENVEKMRAGIPLTDADRAPWLASLRALIEGWVASGLNGVLACSALKQVYREKLVVGPEVRVVYLDGSREVLYQRLQSRAGHFMTSQMLESQLGTLEPPEDAITVDVDKSPQEIVSEIRDKLRLR